MKVRLSGGDYSEIELSGTAAEWLALAHAVRHNGTVIPCESDFNPQPYARIGHQITIIHIPEQKVRFRACEGGVEIEGDPAYLESLSRVMSALSCSLSAGYHVHVEYQGGDHFVASGSVPAILMHLGH